MGACIQVDLSRMHPHWQCPEIHILELMRAL